MIENRSKIEKQIFLGRQYIRKSLRGRAALPEPRSMLLQKSHQASNLDPGIPPISLSPPQTSSEPPISVDTDAEVAFSRGSRWFFKRGHVNSSPSSASGMATPDGRPTPDPLRSATIRRKWTSELLSSTLNGSGPPTPGSSPPTPTTSDVTQRYAKTRSGSFLSRLRTRSYPNFPFSGDTKRASRESSDVTEHGWSSDSSSEDDLTVDDRRHLHYPSVVNVDPLDPPDQLVGDPEGT